MRLYAVSINYIDSSLAILAQNDTEGRFEANFLINPHEAQALAPCTQECRAGLAWDLQGRIGYRPKCHLPRGTQADD